MTSYHQNDFNSDGRSDVLWRDGAGTLTVLNSTAGGGFVLGKTFDAWPTGIATILAGDLNADGRADFLALQGETLGLGLQIGNGSIPYDRQETFVIPATKTIAGMVDINGDGSTDVLLREGGGRITELLSHNSNTFWWDFVTPYPYFQANDSIMTVDVDPSWKVAATGDFNGDGKGDILWRNDGGAMFDFVGTASGAMVNNGDSSWMMVDPSWRLVGIGDFNGDGRADLLFRNSTGTIIDYLANASGGFTDNRTNLSTTVGLDWHVAGIGDYNGDGRADILWRNDNGAVFDFLGTASGGVVNNGDNSWMMIPASWHVQDPFVHDSLI